MRHLDTDTWARPYGRKFCATGLQTARRTAPPSMVDAWRCCGIDGLINDRHPHRFRMRTRLRAEATSPGALAPDASTHAFVTLRRCLPALQKNGRGPHELPPPAGAHQVANSFATAFAGAGLLAATRTPDCPEWRSCWVKAARCVLACSTHIWSN